MKSTKVNAYTVLTEFNPITLEHKFSVATLVGDSTFIVRQGGTFDPLTFKEVGEAMRSIQIEAEQLEEE